MIYFGAEALDLGCRLTASVIVRLILTERIEPIIGTRLALIADIQGGFITKEKAKTIRQSSSIISSLNWQKLSIKRSCSERSFGA
jgi:hypothetical protein